MKRKQILSLILVTLLAGNIVSAELINVGGTSSSEPVKTDTSNGIDIIKELTDTLSVATEEVKDGTTAEGSQSMVTAYAYLTPQRDFGYIHSKGFNATNGDGTVTVAQDDFNNNWNMGSSAIWDTTAQRKLLSVATSYIETDRFIDKLNAVNDSNINKMYIQKDSRDGREFVASTLYVRWLYDVKCTLNHTHGNDSYLKKVPVLNNGGGPYIATGDKMDMNPNVFTDANGVSTIRSQFNSRVKTFSSVVKPGTNLNHQYITEDLNCDGTSAGRNNNAFFEKRYEVRRYIVKGGKSTYEAVVPTEKISTNTRVVLPDTSPKTNIKATTHYNVNGTAVSKYTFDITAVTKSPVESYIEKNKTYTQKKLKNGTIENNSALEKEPGESKMDIWHSNVVPVLQILRPDGSVLKEFNDVNLGNSTYIVYPSQIGNVNLDRHSARIILKYVSNVRFMSAKQDYSLTYNSQKVSGNYQDTITYIENSTNGSSKLALKTDLSNHYDAKNPRIVKTFTTADTNPLETRATTSISAAISNTDLVPPSVTLKVDPPNTLTVLEGAKFNVKLDAALQSKDPNLTSTGDKTYTGDTESYIPAGEVGEHWWVDNFRIEEITIKAQNGTDIPYDNNQLSIDYSNPSSFKLRINNMTANPAHIGQATVHIKYAYDYNHRNWKTTPPEKIGGQWTIEASTKTTPQKGSVSKNFKIYSLSGVTVS